MYAHLYCSKPYGSLGGGAAVGCGRDSPALWLFPYVKSQNEFKITYKL